MNDPSTSLGADVAVAARRRYRQIARRRGIILAIAAAVALIADQVTKLIVRRAIAPGEVISLLPGLDLVRARNEGIAFGLFPGRPGVVAALTVVALLIIAATLLTMARRSSWIASGGGALIGGSVGNLVDRLVHGGVTDFINLPKWPAFNVADMAIVGGAIVVGIGVLLMRDEQ